MLEQRQPHRGRDLGLCERRELVDQRRADGDRDRALLDPAGVASESVGCTATATTPPAATAAAIAGEAAGTQPTIRHCGQRERTARAMPLISPPPPTAT